MTVLSSGDCNSSSAAPPPPPPPATTNGASAPFKVQTGNPDKNLLLADIRNGVKLKASKTNDKSTPTFLKKSNGTSTSPSPSPVANGNGDSSVVEMKDALQEELRNTLKRKVKKQDIERGDCSKNDQIEKAMETNRTEVQLKLNTCSKVASPISPIVKDTVDRGAVKPPTPQPTVTKPQAVQSTFIKANGGVVKQQTSQPIVAKPQAVQSPFIKADVKVKTPAVESPPPKPKRSFQNNGDSPKPTTNGTIAKTKETFTPQAPVKVEIKPFESPKVPLNGTLRQVSKQKPLTIDVNIDRDDSRQNSILSPEVKSGVASIRPSQIKTLTKQGSHVSHTDILEKPKPVSKSPISLVETTPYVYSPPVTPKIISPASSSQPHSPPTPTRTVILDTKLSNGSKTLPRSPKFDPNAQQKKLMMTHPKPSFTLKRNNSQNVATPTPQNPEPKPVFRILTNLERAEQQAEQQKQPIVPKPTKPEPPKADEPGVEPILTSYVSFSKELANAPNNYPDVVTKHTTVGVVKQDLYFDNMNLRDIKIDIVEAGGQLRVVNK